MDIKQEMLYREDIVKTEPRLHSPCASNNGLVASTAAISPNNNGLTTGLAVVTTGPGNALSIVTTNGPAGNLNRPPKLGVYGSPRDLCYSSRRLGLPITSS